jgi:hypothetical protein
VLRQTGRADRAEDQNRRALALLDDLALPALALGIERADTHNLRGHILESRGPEAALAEYRLALNAFAELSRALDVVHQPDFHLRFGDLLGNLAHLGRDHPRLDTARQVLADAAGVYAAVGERAIDAGLTSAAAAVAQTFAELEPDLSDRDRRAVSALHETLRQKLRRTP